MATLQRLFTNLSLTRTLVNPSRITSVVNSQQTRFKCKFVEKPQPGKGQAFRRIVHFPAEYTVEPLKTTNLAGRDPVTGRVVAKGIGGGIKHKYHWVKFHRDGPAEGPPKVERVVDVLFDGCRTSKVALVVCGDEMKYILATENMKPGDLIKTSKFIPRNPVRANEGDAYPLGALPIGTLVHCVEKFPGFPFNYCTAAGTAAKIVRKFDDYVVILLPSKRELALKQECMGTVGRVSNVEHNKEHIGSPQRNRELGNRPRSGLWQRKTGRHGRKIKRPPPMRIVDTPTKEKPQPIKFTLEV
ncbi:large ribosomal subunit protein uL2m [Culicoides brevitarsis]|uniref:large ribosomal subunit protein uL2m n=1 Tax=Culicoides brevitarsis TaxID=469753 RepID=UPI00307C7586